MLSMITPRLQMPVKLSQLFSGGNEFVLKVEDALTDVQAGAEFLRIEGCGQVVVGARIQTMKQIFFLGARGQERNPL
jgi:hypothetical protein